MEGIKRGMVMSQEKGSLWVVHFSAATNGADLNDLYTHMAQSARFGFPAAHGIFTRNIGPEPFSRMVLKTHNVLANDFPRHGYPFKFIFYAMDSAKNLVRLLKLFKNVSWKDSYCFFVDIFMFSPVILLLLLLLPGLKGRFTIQVHYLPQKTRFCSYLKTRVRNAAIDINSKLLSLVIKQAGCVYVTEEINRQELLRYFPNLEPNKVLAMPVLPSYCIGGACKPDLYKKQATGNKKIFLFPGALRIEKGIIDYLRALQMYRPGSEEVIFHLTGTIAKEEAVLVEPELAKTKAILGNRMVYDNSFLPNEAYSRLIRQSSFIVLPYDKSRYMSRGSAVIFDCILNRTPFIGPDYGVFAYYAKTYGIGLTYASGDIEGLARRMQEATSMDAGVFKRGFDEAIGLFDDKVQKEGYLKLLGRFS